MDMLEIRQNFIEGYFVVFFGIRFYITLQPFITGSE